MTDAYAWASGIERTLRRRRGPCPRGKKNARSCVRSRRTQVPIFLEGVPRNGGLGGQMTVSARCAKALTGINPQRFFGFFLIAQKETRPTGRNLFNRS